MINGITPLCPRPTQVFCQYADLCVNMQIESGTARNSGLDWCVLVGWRSRVLEDDHINVLCMGGRAVGPDVAWDLAQAYLAVEYSGEKRHLRRLGKIATLESIVRKTSWSTGQWGPLSINTIRQKSARGCRLAGSRRTRVLFRVARSIRGRSHWPSRSGETISEQTDGLRRRLPARFWTGSALRRDPKFNNTRPRGS
jgi:Ribose/Galactose Isomerase